MGINMHLLTQARQSLQSQQKQAFVVAGDPSMGADPAAAGGGGGAPPMDPAAAGGGGAPPMDPAAAGGGGGAPPADPMASLMPMIQQAVQQAMASQGGGGGAAGGGAAGAGPGLKPKIDVNVEIMQMKKLLARIADGLGIQIPAQEMVATPDDLNQLAEGGPGHAAATPDGGAGGGALGQISPVEPMKSADDQTQVKEAWETGVAFTPPSDVSFADSHRAARSNADLAESILLKTRK